jgi:hypothetical protein
MNNMEAIPVMWQNGGYHTYIFHDYASHSMCLVYDVVIFKVKHENKMLNLDINELQVSHETANRIFQHQT